MWERLVEDARGEPSDANGVEHDIGPPQRDLYISLRTDLDLSTGRAAQSPAHLGRDQGKAVA